MVGWKRGGKQFGLGKEPNGTLAVSFDLILVCRGARAGGKHDEAGMNYAVGVRLKLLATELLCVLILTTTR